MTHNTPDGSCHLSVLGSPSRTQGWVRNPRRVHHALEPAGIPVCCWLEGWRICSGCREVCS